MNIILIHRTVGVLFDDRIKKIFKSLLKLENINVFAFLWERENLTKKGNFSQGGTYHVMKLPFASKKFPRPGWILTCYEIIAETIQGFVHLKRYNYDVIIIQNHRLFLLMSFVLFFMSKGKRIVWDLRELPIKFMKKNSLRAYYFSLLMKKCDAILTTSISRKNFLTKIFGHKVLSNCFVIPNYPLIDWHHLKPKPLLDYYEELMKKRPICYLQNANTETRYPYNSVKALLLETNHNIFISGHFPSSISKELLKEFGDDFRNRVHFLGMINSEQILRVLNNSLFSVILYNYDFMNNDLCDPNRLYQAISRSVPVIVGSNLGLSQVIHDENCGVVIKEDGRSLSDLQIGIRELLKNYNKFKKNACIASHKYVWEKYEDSLYESILGKNFEIESINKQIIKIKP